MGEWAPYMSFLVRLWREPSQETPAPPADWHNEILTWRVSLESPHTGERHGFASFSGGEIPTGG